MREESNEAELTEGMKGRVCGSDWLNKEEMEWGKDIRGEGRHAKLREGRVTSRQAGQTEWMSK